MKYFLQRFLGLSMLLFFCVPSLAQENEIQRCNADAYMQTLLQNKSYRKAYEKRQAMVAAKSKDANEKAPCSTPVNLPMAIHFQGVTATAANQACLEQLAISQVQVLNDDYQGTNADISEWINTASASFPNVNYSESCLDFCIATSNHPTGYGLSNGEYAITYNAFSNSDNADWAGYINIFVRANTGVLGYSPVGGWADGDGVTIEAAAFGILGFNCLDAGPDNETWAYNYGRTLTHEVGHYLNLDHIWGGGCNADDGVSDTPDSEYSYFGCPAIGGASCGSTDMHMNYMDYTNDACMYMFTAGQATRSENYVATYLGAELKQNVCGLPATPTCDDGYQNGDETGVDCGGSCPAICATCNDGILNNGETAIDCGGANCPACPCSNYTVFVSINFDSYAAETSWELAAADGSIMASGSGYSNGMASIYEMVCLDEACYTFTIYDLFNDGLCCEHGEGNYAILDEDGISLLAGSQFTTSETKSFCLGNITPTCDDGIQNGNETGVDCGGNCPTVCETCNDGILNNGEAEIDCGGANCVPCTSCNDGILNGDETAIDCGGSCDACPTCNDGVLNGDETGVDCGGADCGPCGSCSENALILTVTLDDYGEETSWFFANSNGNVLLEQNSYPNQLAGTVYTYEICLPNGCYEFTMADSYGDGMCCNVGNGAYSLATANGTILASGASFGYSENTPFCFSATTCNDGILNGNETGIDCGGDCAACSSSCTEATGLFSTLSGATSVTLAWAAQTDAQAYQLAGRKLGGDIKVFPQQSSNSRTFNNGIQPNTTYQWSVRVLCDGVWTDWASPIMQFTTPSARLGEAVSSFDIFGEADNFLTSQIYPNPAKNEVTVELMSAKQTAINVRLLDLTGKLLLEKTVDSSVFQTRTTLDISNLQNGYYFVAVNNGEETNISKLSVIR